MNLGPYFEAWFQFSYYTCLVPFKIENNGKAYFVSTNFVQMTLCAIFHISSSIASVAEIRGVIASNISRDQALLIKLIERTNSLINSLIFIHHVWLRQEKVIAIFGSPIKQKNTNNRIKVEIWSWVFMILTFSLIVSTFLSWLTFNGSEDFDIENIILKRTRSFYYEYMGTKLNDDDASKWRAATAVALVPRFYKWVLVDLLTYLVGISSWVTLVIAKEFKKNLMNSDLDNSEIFEYYYKLKEAVEKFNEFLGPTYVKIFISLILFCAVNVTEILNAKSMYFPLYLGFYFGLSIIPFIFAAEAHGSMTHFKSWLLSRPKRSISTLFDYLNVSNYNLALRGSYFFTITYNFMGTTCSVVLTYAILMMQSGQTGPGTQLPK